MLSNVLKIAAATLVMLIVIILVVIGEVVISPKLAATPRATFPSPNGGAYKVVVYVYSLPTVAMPGQGSDRDGFARVYNSASGALLCEIDVPLAGQVYEHDIRWRGDTVAIPGWEGFESCPLHSS